MNATDTRPEQNGTADEAAESPTRGMDAPRPRKAPKARERKRRDYAGELADLTANVNAAIRLLEKIDAGADAKLLAAAVEMLTL